MTRPWMDKEIMIAGLTKYTAVQLAKKWQCDKRTIHMWAKRHGIELHKCWPIGDLEYLKKNAMTMSYARIGKRLKRSHESVRNMAVSLGISIFDELMDYTLLSDVAVEFGVNISVVHHFMLRHKFPVHKLRSNRIGKLYHVIQSEVDEWLKQGHILRLTRDNLSPRLQSMWDNVRAQFISESELTAIDPWLGAYSLQMQKKRGTPPKPLMIGKRGESTYETYYRKDAIYAHYFIYGDTIPIYIRCDWIDAIRESWNSVYISTYELYKIIPKATAHQYHRDKNFPSCHYRAYYDRAELVTWLEAYGWHDRAKLIKSDPVTYQELIAYRNSRRFMGRHDTSWQ